MKSDAHRQKCNIIFFNYLRLPSASFSRNIVIEDHSHSLFIYIMIRSFTKSRPFLTRLLCKACNAQLQSSILRHPFLDKVFPRLLSSSLTWNQQENPVFEGTFFCFCVLG